MGAMAKNPKYVKAESLLGWWSDIKIKGNEEVNGFPSQSCLATFTDGQAGGFGSKELYKGEINQDPFKLVDERLKGGMSDREYLQCIVIFNPENKNWRVGAAADGVKASRYCQIKRQAIGLVVKMF